MTAILLVSLPARGVLLVSEPFTYPDGNIVGAAGSAWAAHSSAGAGSITVSSNQLKLILASGEDINVSLTNSPYNTANGVSFLYASMTVDFTALPHATGGGASGNYFAHFKETSSTTGFRCRLFAAQTNAANGFYRLSIGSTNTPFTSAGMAQYPLDLALNTAYTVVLRLNLNTGNSTLWLNPTNEASSSVSSTADPDTTGNISAFAFRQPGSSAPGTVMIDNLKIGTAFTDVAGPNTAPVIGAIGDQNTPSGTILGPINVTIGDTETLATNLILHAVSSNPTLIPDTSLTLGGTAENRTLTLTPLPGQQGSATITVSVTDTDSNTASAKFILTVGAPALSAIADQNIPQGSVVPPLPFTLIDHENDALTLTGVSSNAGLVPNTTNNLAFGGAGTNRTLLLTPLPGQSGLSTITLTVTDGHSTNTTSFTLAINPQYGLLFADSFSYPDGPLLGASNSPWLHHSPTGTNNLGELQVASGSARLNQGLNEDLNATLTNGPFASSNAVILYCGLTLRLTSLPAKTGDYFIHYKDGGSTFRGKIFVQTADAAAGSYRLSVANAASAPVAEIAQDLSLNTAYTVVFRYDTASATTTLWVNPAAESDPSVTATDAAAPSTIAALALREDSGIGVLQVDDLKVGTSFNGVAGNAPKIQYLKPSFNTVQFSWSATANYTLQSSLNLTNWQTAGAPVVSNNQNVVVLTNNGSHLFFRLKQ